MPLYLHIIAIVLILFSSNALSQNPLLISDEKLALLAGSEKWQKLIKIEELNTLGSKDFAIHSQDFYLTESKLITAESELKSTLLSLLDQQQYLDINQHPQCRFPARFIWLKKQIDLSSITDVKCPNFEQWAKLSTTKSLSLVFATGYLGNPASYYGHTLIKLNPNKKTQLSLLDTSINFGAEVPENEDPLSYMIKGVVGGYDGSFTHSKFYYHTQNYLENELRNLWEYELNLEQEDYQFLVAHMWELIEQKYTYYFLDENCVYRMYELFGLIDGIELPQLNPLWVIPQEVVRAINQINYKNKPLVKSISYIPSRQSQFYSKYWQLNEAEKSYVTDIVNSPKNIAKLTSSNVSVVGQRKILSVLLDYYQYLMAVDKDNEIALKRVYDQILAYRFKLPIGKAEFVSKKPKSPENSRPSSYSQLSYINNKYLGDGIRFKLRPAYYDQLDAESGHVKNGALKMAELELDYFSSSLSISSLSLFDIVSVKNKASGLPYDNYDSWTLYLGLRKQEAGCKSCTDLVFEAKKGWAMPINNKTLIGAYLGGALTENYQNRGRAYTSASVTLNHSLTDNINFLVNVEARKYLENDYLSEVKYLAQMRYKLKVSNEHIDFRIGAREDEVILGMGYYW